jgi:hypothetical protein
LKVFDRVQKLRIQVALGVAFPQLVVSQSRHVQRSL